MDKFLKKSVAQHPSKVEIQNKHEPNTAKNIEVLKDSNLDHKSNDNSEISRKWNDNTAKSNDKSATDKEEQWKSNKTPNKRKKLKRNIEERDDNIQLSAQTISETPEHAKTTPVSNDCINNENMEEDKQIDSNLNMEVEDDTKQDSVRRSKRGRKPKAIMEDQEPQSDKKRARKQKQKVVEDAIPENVEELKSSIKVYQKLLQRIINAGISENFNLDKSDDAEILKKTLVMEQNIDKRNENKMDVDPILTPSKIKNNSKTPLVEPKENKDDDNEVDEESPLCCIWKLDISEWNCEKLRDSINNDIHNESELIQENSPESELSEIEKCLDDTEEQANNEELIPIDTKLLEDQIKLLIDKNKVKKLELKENQSLEKKQQKLAKLREKEAQRLERQRLKEEKEALKKKKQQEAEELRLQKLEEKQRKLQEIAQKKEEEKQRKLQELTLKKQEQEESKRKKEEEIQRKKDEEAKRKEEQLKAQQAKENSQKKLLNFFKKNSPKKDETMIEEPKNKTVDILSTIKQLEVESSDPNIKCLNIADYWLYLRNLYNVENHNEFKRSIGKSRKKEIFIEGSYKKMSWIWVKTSRVINGRNPFKKDENIIDYDMDSEEEFEEEHGDDINSDNNKEEDEEDMSDEGEEGSFIVPDGYLSQSEKNWGEAEANANNEEYMCDMEYNQIKKERQINTVMKPIVMTFANSNKSDYSSYKIFATRSYISFPIIIKAKEFDGKSEEEEKKEKYDPNAINLKLKELISMLHGSYESKEKIIDDFNTQNPEWTKASIERKIKEISSKEKHEDQGKQRYVVSQEVIDSSIIDKAELQALYDQRFKRVQDEIDKVEEAKQLEKQKKKEEKEKIKSIEREK